MFDATTLAQYDGAVAMRLLRVGGTWRSIISMAVLALPLHLADVALANPGKPLTNAGPLLEEYGKQAQDTSRSELERSQIIGLLGLWATDDVRAPLIALLGDTSPVIRAAAARALGWEGNKGATPALKALLEAPGEKVEVRVAALEALGRIGDDSVRDAVVAATRDPDPAVRGAALFGLAFEKLTNPADRLTFLRQMAEDQALERAMRSNAVQALGALKDSPSAPLLLRLLEQEPAVQMPVPAPKPTERENMALRYRQARDVKAWAAQSLYMMEAREAIPVLLKTAEDPHDFFVRLASLQAIGSWRVPEALPVLLKRLDDPYDQNRVVALWALGGIGDRSVVDPVLRYVNDKVPEVRAQAVLTLGVLGDPRVRPELEALQEKEQDPRVLDALAQSLAKLPR